MAVFVWLLVAVGFACRYPEIQMILFRCKNAGGKICEGTGWGIGFVEIDKDFSIRIYICNKIAARGIRFVPGSEIPKADEERAVVFLVDIKLIMISLKFKSNIAFHRKF